MEVSKYDQKEGAPPQDVPGVVQPDSMNRRNAIQPVPPARKAPAHPSFRKRTGDVLNRYLDTPRKKKIAALSIVVTLFFSYTAFPFLFNRGPQLSAYSDEWNGLSDLRELVESKGYDVQSIVSNPSLLEKLREDREELKNTLLFIAGVERRYTREEIDAILEFVVEGGKLILADDFGYAYRISGRLGVGFLPGRLYDLPSFRSQGSLSLIETSARSPSGDESFSLLLNEPSALGGVDDGDVWARSSSGHDAFVDMNDNK